MFAIGVFFQRSKVLSWQLRQAADPAYWPPAAAARGCEWAEAAASRIATPTDEKRVRLFMRSAA
jgi:hypothetical protein